MVIIARSLVTSSESRSSSSVKTVLPAKAMLPMRTLGPSSILKMIFSEVGVIDSVVTSTRPSGRPFWSRSILIARRALGRLAGSKGESTESPTRMSRNRSRTSDSLKDFIPSYSTVRTRGLSTNSKIKITPVSPSIRWRLASAKKLVFRRVL